MSASTAQAWMLVAAGGAVGAVARFALGQALLARYGGALPWGTLAANLVGSFAAGAMLGWLDGRPALEPLRLLVVVGLLGGLTTFSGLAVEVLLLARGPRPLASAAYLVLTLVAGLGLAALGARLGLHLRG